MDEGGEVKYQIIGFFVGLAVACGVVLLWHPSDEGLTFLYGVVVGFVLTFAGRVAGQELDFRAEDKAIARRWAAYNERFGNKP